MGKRTDAIRYRFTMGERELEIVLAALGIIADIDMANGHDDEVKEARALLVRLDSEADQQFLTREHPQHAG